MVFFQAVIRCYPEVRKAIGRSEKIFEYMDRKPVVPPDGTLAPENLKGHIQFKNVCFSYGDKDKDTDKSKMILQVCVSYSHFYSSMLIILCC